MTSTVICNTTEQVPLGEAIVLILAPTGRDAEGATLLLNKAGIQSHVCASFQALYEAIGESTGVILVAEEAFREDMLQQLLARLEEQPVWSDLPLIVLTRPSSSNRLSSRDSLSRLSQVIGNIMFLERPLYALTLVSAVQTALKARRRQYQSRDYLIEREQIAEELMEYQRKLEESNRELEQFATIASHDLQAPLRKVEVFVDLLEKNEGSSFSEESVNYINRMKKSIHWMQQLITDLLNLSRVTRQRKPFGPVDLSEVIQSAWDDLIAVKRTTNGRIEIDNQVTTPLMGDRDQLQQMFQNLIENGLKFHRKEVPPVIRVTLKTLDHHCQITVEDNGIGFDEQYANRIFETFQRLHGQNEYPGTGIGLSIVRKIIDLHHGHIAVSSSIGHGSSFIINLPIHPEMLDIQYRSDQHFLGQSVPTER